MLRLLVVILALAQMTAAVPAAPGAPACGSCCEQALLPDGGGAPPCCTVAPERPEEWATLSAGRAAINHPSPAVGPLVTPARWSPLAEKQEPSDCRFRHRRLTVLRI